MSKEKLTYLTIAKKANVGVGTVSRYFHNYNISDEAKLKIKKVLENVEYVPNYAAANIKKPNKDVYLILPFNSEQKANMEIVNGVKTALNEEQFNFFVFISSEDCQHYIQDLQNLKYRNSYGLILLLPKFSNQQLYETIQKIKTTHLIVYNRKVDNVDYECIKDRIMFEKLAQKIDLKFQNKKIVFLGLSNIDLTSGKARTEGFINNIKNNETIVYQLERNCYDEVYKLMGNIIENDKPNIIVSATHTIALTVYNYLIERNIRENYIITDIKRKTKNQLNRNFDFNIVIDYFSIGYKMGKKLIGNSVNINNLFEIY